MTFAGKLALVVDVTRPCGRSAGTAAVGALGDALDDAVGWTLPLVERLRALAAEGLPVRVALCLPPAAGTRLRDPRFAHRVDERVSAPGMEPVRAAWEALGRDVIGAIADLEGRGCVEVLGGTATDVPLPLLAAVPRSIRAQVAVGCAEHPRLFGHRPRGLWLAAGAWTPDLDEVLADEGVGFVVLADAAVLHAVPRPVAGVHAPVATPAGVIALGADADASRAFHEPTDTFVSGLTRRSQELAGRLGRPPLFVVAPDLVAPTDAPVAGVLDRIEGLVRRSATPGAVLELVTPAGLLEGRASLQRSLPVASRSREADAGHAPILRHVHRASRELTALSRARPEARGVERRALTQAARELLLLEGSAGALIARACPSPDAATCRFQTHLARFLRLTDAVRSGALDEVWLREVEGKDDLFESLDYRLYR